MKFFFLLFLLNYVCFQKCYSNCFKNKRTFTFYISTPVSRMTKPFHRTSLMWKKNENNNISKNKNKHDDKSYKSYNSYKNERNERCSVKCFMKRLRNASVEIDVENRKDLSKVEIIKMFIKGVKECKNVEYLKERLKGHIPRTTKRKMMKQKRMINLRMHIKNCKIRKAEVVPPEKNILNFPKDKLKEINASVLYFRHYFGKFEKENEEEKKKRKEEAEKKKIEHE